MTKTDSEKRIEDTFLFHGINHLVNSDDALRTEHVL